MAIRNFVRSIKYFGLLAVVHLYKRIKVCYDFNKHKNMRNNLTEKQLGFCTEYVSNGYNGAQAYKVAYKQDNYDTCKAQAYYMLRLPQIQEGIKNAELDYRVTGHGVGINKEAVLSVIKRALNAKRATKDGEEYDYNAQLKAIEVYAKLVGDFSPEKKSVVFDDISDNVDVSKMTPEERDAYKAKILAEL